MKSKQKSIKNFSIFFLFLIYSFGILYICTASSPRYAINPWNDANAFLTVGKAMANGLTIYKDIFEQKGPLLYLIHAVACLISDTSFTGVYVMQSLFLSVTAFAAYKIASLYINTGWSIIAACLTSFVTVNSTCYYYGDSAEEFCIPLLMISLYYFCAYFKNTEQYTVKKSVFFLIGFFAGCVAMIKFTVIGFWFAWAAYISLYTIFAKKDFKKAVINALVFLGGMAAAIVPWIIYFAVKGALYDFIYTYFVLNATAYPKNENYSIIGRLAAPLYCIWNAFGFNRVLFILGFGGIIIFLLANIFTDKKFFSRISVPFVCLLGIYIIYFGLRTYNYYFLPTTTFVIFTFIFICYILQKIFKSKEKIVSVICCVLCIALTFVSSNFTNVSSKYVTRKGTQTVQEQAAEYIQEHNPEGKILTYNCLDAGVYLMDNQIPAFRYFERQNFIYEKYSENVDEQNRYINEHLADYVVAIIGKTQTIDEIYDENSTLKSDYNIALCKDFSVQASRYLDTEYFETFYLFELKPEFSQGNK